MDNKKEKKTPNYTTAAVANYRDKHDYFQLHLQKGLKERMKNAGIKNMSAYISNLVVEDLEKQGK